MVVGCLLLPGWLGSGVSISEGGSPEARPTALGRWPFKFVNFLPIESRSRKCFEPIHSKVRHFFLTVVCLMSAALGWPEELARPENREKPANFQGYPKSIIIRGISRHSVFFRPSVLPDVGSFDT